MNRFSSLLPRLFPRAALQCLFALCSGFLLTPRSSYGALETTAPLPALVVQPLDENGQPLPQAESILFRTGKFGSTPLPWRTWHDGGIRYYREDLVEDPSRDSIEGSYQLIIRAQGYAPASQPIDLPRLPLETTFTLTKGKRVELTLESYAETTVPTSLIPWVYYEGQTAQAWTAAETRGQGAGSYGGDPFTISFLENLGPGRFAFHLPVSHPPIRLMILRPGYLQHFETPSFDTKSLESGKLHIQLPEPGTLRFTTSQKPGSKAYHAMLFREVAVSAGRPVAFCLGQYQVRENSAHIVHGLPPGRYMVSRAGNDTANTAIDVVSGQTSHYSYPPAAGVSTPAAIPETSETQAAAVTYRTREQRLAAHRAQVEGIVTANFSAKRDATIPTSENHPSTAANQLQGTVSLGKLCSSLAKETSTSISVTGAAAEYPIRIRGENLSLEDLVTTALRQQSNLRLCQKENNGQIVYEFSNQTE